MKAIALIQDSREALWRIRDTDREKLFRLLFHRYPEREWGTFFQFGFRRTHWGLLITWINALKPEPGDLDRGSPIVEFRPRYIHRALTTFDDGPLAVGVIHSHPEGCAVSPSISDDDMDTYYAEEFERFSGGRPYASIIVARDADGELSFSGRVFDRGQWFEIKTCLTVGKKLIREQARTSWRSAKHLENNSHPEVLERVTDLLGKSAPKILKNAVVGVVGCSGTGSPAMNVLTRANIGEIVAVDPGRFKISNHQRNHASRFPDLSLDPAPYKAWLALRMIKEINPDTKVRAFVGDVLDDIVLDELLRCDVILGCSDSNYARAALGDIASQYLVPVVDLAVQMRAEGGRLSEQLCEIAHYEPGVPCPWCRNRVSAADIRYETSTKAERKFMAEAAADAERRGVDGAQYWGGTPPPELTVGYLTTAVGALGAGYAQNLILGCASIPHSRFQFDVGVHSLGVVEDCREADPECACQKFIGWADQAKADRSVSKPSHWPDAWEVSLESGANERNLSGVL
jgi:hypothetical protein